MPRRPWIAVVLLLLAGTLAYLPAIRSPFLFDDYRHAAMIDGTFPVHRSPFDLYSFVGDADRTVLVERGLLPWWSHPRLTIRFFRPLSSALLWADHKLFGNGPLPLHLHSLAWWVAAVLAARSLFRRLLAPRVAALATIVFALAPCHALPLAWLANREALLSLTLGILGLSAHLRFRRGLALADGAVAAAFFALALLGGEYGLCFGGYVLALEIAARGDALGRRALRLLPFAVPAAAYLTARAALGYGVTGSGFYADPFHEPARFLREAPLRLATLLVQEWATLDHDTLREATTPWWVLALVAVSGVALLFVPLRRTFARLDGARRETAAWLLMGSVLALGPVLAVVPSPRVLGASLLGTAPIVALILETAWFPASPPERRGAAELTWLVALLLGFAHLVHGPVTSWLVARRFQKDAVAFEDHAAALRGRLDLPEDGEVVMLRGLGDAFYLPFALEEHGVPPARWRILSQTGHVLARRRDARTLDLVVPAAQGIFSTAEGNLFRSVRGKDAPLAVGDTFAVPGMRVTVLEMGEEAPRAVRFAFDRDLEAGLPWLVEEYGGFLDAPPPAVGFGKPFDP